MVMTPDRAPELLRRRVEFDSGHNRNTARLVLREVQLEHGQAAVDGLIWELDLERHLGLRPCPDFSSVV
jgi:hypothetical protein